MNGLFHPFTGFHYEQDGHGNILVSTNDGRTGTFKRTGEWVSGVLLEADPQFCNWIGGPLSRSHRVS